MGIVLSFRERVANFLAPVRQTPSPRSSSLFIEQATNDFLRWIGQMAEPDEVLKKAGVTRYALRVLSGDDDITAALETRIEALLGTEWRMEAQEDGGTTPEDARLFIEQQFRPHHEKFLRACMEALPYGYSVQECIYARNDDGRIVIKEITEKPFEWFVPKLDGTVLWKSREKPMGEPTDPRKYFLTARRQTYRNPYGESLFSRLYWPWLFRTAGWKHWVKWLERFGNPFVVGMTAGSEKTMATALAAAASSANIAVGQGDSVEIVQAQGTGEQFERFERAVCGRYQRLILGQTLTSDAGGSSGKSGSYALGKVHNEVRLDRRNADCRMCMQTGQKLVDVLWELNGFQGQPPKFVIQDGTGLEEERAQRDSTLMKAGLKLTVDYFMRVYDFQEGDIDEEAMEAAREASVEVSKATAANPEGKVDDNEEKPNSKGGPAQQGKQTKPPRKFVLARQFTRSQQEIEDQLDALLEDVESPIPDAAIKDAIRAATSPADLTERLSVLLAGRPVGEFSDTLGRALYVADVMGYAGAERSE